MCGYIIQESQADFNRSFYKVSNGSLMHLTFKSNPHERYCNALKDPYKQYLVLNNSGYGDNDLIQGF